MRRASLAAMMRALVFLCAAGCGTSPAMAELPDADPTLVRVTATALDNPDIPSAGIEIVFSNPDGSIAGVVMTDAQGGAAFSLPSGGSVSALWQKSSWHFSGETAILETLAGVQPGDQIDLSMTGAEPVACTPSVKTQVTLPAVPGATGYRVYDSAIAHDFHAALTGEFVFSSCGRGDLLAVAYNNGGDPLAISELQHVDLNMPPATIAMPAFHAVGTFHAELDHADVTGATLALARTSRFFADTRTPAIAPTVTADFAAVDEHWGDMRMVATVTTAAGTRRIDDPLAPGDTTHAIDLATDLPATTLAAHYANRRLDVTPSTPFSASYLYLHFIGTTPDHDALDWHVIAAPTTTSLVLPALPAELAPYDLAATATPTAMLVQSASLADWATSRGTLFAKLLRTLRGTAMFERVVTIQAP